MPTAGCSAVACSPGAPSVADSIHRRSPTHIRCCRQSPNNFASCLAIKSARGSTCVLTAFRKPFQNSLSISIVCPAKQLCETAYFSAATI